MTATERAEAPAQAPDATTTTPTATPATMRAAVLVAPRTIAVEERSVPEPGPGEVLVRVEAVGLCGSDVHYFEHGRIGEFVVTGPLVLGHEPGGTVVAHGPVLPHAPAPPPVGQLVAIEPGRPCWSCDRCQSGAYNLCPDMVFYATPPVDGAFCEYVAVPAGLAHPVPEGTSAAVAGMLEPLSVGVWACRKAGVGLLDRVLVTGAGPVGLLALVAARARGARHVAVADLNADRLRVAGDLGADELVDLREGSLADAGVRADVLLECSGAPPALDAGLRALDDAGRAVLIGLGPDEVRIPVAHVQRREISLTGVFRYAGTWPEAAEIARRAGLERLVTHRFGLDEVATALQAPAADPSAVKVVVEPQR